MFNAFLEWKWASYLSVSVGLRIFRLSSHHISVSVMSVTSHLMLGLFDSIDWKNNTGGWYGLLCVRLSATDDHTIMAGDGSQWQPNA